MAVIALVLLIPLALISALELSRTSERVAVASDIAPLTQSVEEQLQLIGALQEELLSSSWNAGGHTVATTVPDEVVTNLGLNFDGAKQENRDTVDELLREAQNATLTAQVAEAREVADSEDSLFPVVDIYAAVIETIQADLAQTTRQLVAAGTRTGDQDTTSSALAAQAVANYRVTSGAQLYNWGGVVAATLLQDTSPELIDDYILNLGQNEDRRVELESLIGPSEDLVAIWQAIEDQGDVAVLRSASNAATRAAIEQNSRDDLSTLNAVNGLDIMELIEIGQRFATVRQATERLGSRIQELSAATLEDLENQASRASDDAAQDRAATIGLLVLATALTALGLVAHAIFVVRPLHRLANAAEMVGKGDLTVSVPVTGAREVRSGADALNEAISSLHLVESQAVALAEERLEDPALQQEAPGALGQSLQIAVRRLATSLAERDEFEERLSHEAAHDGLTKLANRTATLRHLERALNRSRRAPTTVALLFIDID